MMTFIAIVVFLFSAFSLAMTGIEYKRSTPKERKKNRSAFALVVFQDLMSLLLSLMVIVNAL